MKVVMGMWGLAVGGTLLLWPASSLAAQDADAASAAWATEARTTAPSVEVVEVTTPPVVDGSLDDPSWREALVMGGFVQRFPFDGRPASERTEVRVLRHADALYVGVWAFDDDPSAIVVGERIRDSQLDDSDAVVLLLDTFLDRTNGFVFGTNPSGIEYDGQVANQGQGGGGGMGFGGRAQGGSGGGFNVNWDGNWEVATSRDAQGWYAEFRIPFSTLRYGPDEVQSWGFNVMRRIRRHNEESFWSPVPRQFNLYRVSAAGVLTGLTPPALRTLSVTPYLLGSASRDYQAGDTEFSYPGDVGADAKVQVTPGLTLDLTYNTDFAQVEVDEAQVNLTRFSISFPEKRPFFLENSGFFNVGTGGADLFFSRRIGINQGLSVPIQGGGRLSGRAGGLNVGLLHIRTEDANLDGFAPIGGEAFSVVRLARELPNRSRVGTFFSDRGDTGGGGSQNRTYAVDGQLGLGENLTVSSFLARTETPGMEGRDHAFNVSGNFGSRDWRLMANYRELGEDFSPQMGFAPRTGYRYYQGMWMYYWRPDWLFREIRPHMSYATHRSLSTGFEETARVHVDAHFEFPSGLFFSPAYNWNREGLEEPFTIADGVTVAPGTYEGWEAAWEFNTDESAPVSLSSGISWGSFLSGTRRGTRATVTARRGSSISTALRVEHNDVELAEGSFSATLVGLRLAYFFTPRVNLQSLIQYSDQLDTWSANLRFGWQSSAGTGLFLVFNDARGFNTLEGPLNRSVTLKYSRQFDVLTW